VALVTGTGATGDDDNATTLVAQTKTLHIEKDMTVPGGTANVLGEVISYTMAVTNTGNAAIAGVVVTDAFTSDEAPVLSGGFNVGDADHDNLLDVSESWSYTASHVVTQAELDSGAPIVNLAVVTGTGATGDDDDATTPVTQTKTLHIEKDMTVPGGTANVLGEVISYMMAVTNTGNAAIAGVVVTDAFTSDEAPVLSGGFNSGDIDRDTLLDVTETWQYTASHAVTQAELDSGAPIVNVAVVTGTGATGDDDDATTTVVVPAVLGDFVWIDLNANGQQDVGEPGLNGVLVTLTGAGPDGDFNTLGDNTTATQNTANNGMNDGAYKFINLAPGNYKVTFGAVAGYTRTVANIGADTSDSDANVSTGVTDPYTLISGQTNNTIDAGYYQFATIGDFVWSDLNANGIQDSGELGINSVTVKLLNSNNQVFATTTTNASGAYAFIGVTPGSYSVQFVTPVGGYTATTANAGNDAIDSDANTGTGVTGPYTLISGQTNNTIDAGYILPLAPDIHLEKTVSPSPVAANVPVTYTYLVTNPGGVALDNVTVRDDNATPGNTNDDFTPAPTLKAGGFNIGDADGDNLLDVGEVWQYTTTLIPTVTMAVTTSTGVVYASGTLTYATLGNGDVRVTYLQANAINDNSYGTGSDSGWTSQGKTHKFTDLTGSDKAGFLVKYSDGTTLAQFYQDYITLGGTNTEGYTAFSGYQSLGFSGGDGSFVAGNSAVLKDFDSTLETNLNQSGLANNGVAYTAMTVNSPVLDSKWNVVDGYSFVIDKSAFTGGKSFGGVTIFDQHNSPAKVGTTNTLIPYVIGGPVTNIAVASGTGGGSTVTDSDDATVQILGTPRKFYTVDPGTDKIYGYTAGGGLIATNSQQSGNTDAYGITGDAAGTKLWVLDLDKTVNVYNTNGTALGQWTATDIGATPEGIALDGNDLWMLDRATRAIKWYDDAALNTSGTDTAEKTFILPTTVNIAKGITTDGTTLWVVEDDSANTVFRYTIVRSLGTPTGLTAAGSWTLNSANTTPTGITLDPTGASNSLWVVDSGTDTVYEYANARSLTSGTGFLASTFKLTAANTNAQDIFDPFISNSGQVDDTIVPLDGQLGAFGVQLAEVSAAGDQGADIRIQLASSSELSGLAQGVLGSTFANDITINGDWNHYVGADRNSACAGQIDFQSVIAHESGPVLGLGHSSDLASAMSPYLAAGQAKHDLSASDLVILDWVFLDSQHDDSGPEVLLAHGRQSDARVGGDGGYAGGRTGDRHIGGMTRASSIFGVRHELDWVLLDSQHDDSGPKVLLANGKRSDVQVGDDDDDRYVGGRTGDRHIGGMTRASSIFGVRHEH
jgi:hypothetical protein